MTSAIIKIRKLIETTCLTRALHSVLLYGYFLRYFRGLWRSCDKTIVVFHCVAVQNYIHSPRFPLPLDAKYFSPCERCVTPARNPLGALCVHAYYMCVLRYVCVYMWRKHDTRTTPIDLSGQYPRLVSPTR